MEENILTMPRCKFCGKTMIADKKLLTESDAEEYAVMHCNCEMAEDYRLKVKKEEEKEKDKKRSAMPLQASRNIARKRCMCLRLRNCLFLPERRFSTDLSRIFQLMFLT